ncbi:MAG: thermonuclease family protein, partial [Pseudomonadota bacterium]
VYPVIFVALDTKTLTFCIAIDGEKKKVGLDAIKKTATHVPDEAVKSFEDFLKNSRLRIKYEPSRIDADGVIHGSLYLKSGSPIEIEVLRRGLAAYNTDGLSALQKEAFMHAEKQAREEKAGIWRE